jgi:dTDP-4-amino-4,6-dideoxygalactose transaminase
LDSIQAALLNIKIKHLTRYTSARTENAKRYHQLMQEAALAGRITLPPTAHQCGHVWNQFTVRIPNGYRDQVRQQLAELQVGSEIYYPIPLHQQACFSNLGYERGSLPHTEKAAGEVLSLPIFPELTLNEQQYVVDCLSQIINGRFGSQYRMAS